MHTVAIVQARMGSSRLPGKMTADIAKKPALARVFERLARAQFLDQIVLATTTAPEDDVLEDLARNEGVAVFRGSEEDVLGRVCGAAHSVKADVIVEVTGDCLLVDWELIDKGVEIYYGGEYRFVTNVLLDFWTYPQGVDVFVLGAEDLYEVARIAHDPAYRESPALYFMEHPDVYQTHLIEAPEAFRQPDWRFQLDYEADLEFIRTIYSALYGQNPAFRTPDIFSLLAQKPHLLELNIHMEEKAVRGEGSRVAKEAI